MNRAKLSQIVVAQGKLGNDKLFLAEEVLAKHDENYMPPDAAYALKKGKEANQATGVTGGSQTKDVK